MVADSDEKRDPRRDRDLNSKLIDLSRRELIDTLDRYRITGHGVILHRASVLMVPQREGGVRHEGDDGGGQDKGRHDLG